MVRLNQDWKRIVRRAWSFRLIVVSCGLDAIEVALFLFVDAFPRGVFLGLSVVTKIAAGVMRVVAQKGYDDD